MYSEMRQLTFFCKLTEQPVATTANTDLTDELAAVCHRLSDLPQRSFDGVPSYGTLMEDRSPFLPEQERCEPLCAAMSNALQALSPAHRAAAALHYFFTFPLSQSSHATVRNGAGDDGFRSGNFRATLRSDPLVS